ncbi:MAG: DMT family transporter [Sphingomonadaceae bacterium]|jgi:S-adenosylmethionine uptake transporter
MARDHPLLPFLAVIAGIATFSAMDAVMKSAAIAAGVFTAILLRNVFGTLLMIPVWAFAGRPVPTREALRVHLLRSAVTSVMALLFFYGLVRIPLAEAIAISFIAPLIALYFAALILGETIRPAAILASLLGLAGVLVIGAARFGRGGFDADSAWGIAAILTSAVFYAFNLVLQRKQALLAGPIEIALVQNLFVALLLSIAAPWFLHWPEPTALHDIAAGAVLATAALLFLSWGYARAEAQALVPIEYTGFLWAALFGWLWFGERVGVATVIGAVLIVIGCWIAARKPTEMTVL